MHHKRNHVEPQLLTPKETAAVLRISLVTLRRLATAEPERLPRVHVGPRLVRFSADAVAAFISAPR